ncbi:fructosamine kinase family protein [Parapedobacter tibetensis]|uniref:fructosamine kinase family protein n=1 Tax=Parapedobacter tibetensis TaxID=2972951 RepID=UPI00214D86C0|nr:fructosamine kinase family protein [Parapedobacter tibetensis]
MFLSQPIVQALEAAIKGVVPNDYQIKSIVSVSGGDINRAYHIKTQSGQYFVKVNDANRAIQLFLAESKGLMLLRESSSSVNAPHTFTVGQAHGDTFILMEWIDMGSKNDAGSQALLGRMVAALHRHHANDFGLDHDNFIGSLLQINTQSADWTDFFIQQRLQKQLDIAQKQLLNTSLQRQFDQLFARLDTLYPQEPPSLLHGDLWGGNYLIGTNGQPVLIDPAVYYGHREMDIAMTKLFGGFSQRFYAAYHEDYPLQDDWETRIDLWNLYPLLVHFNLFGGGYLSQLKNCLKQYI